MYVLATIKLPTVPTVKLKSIGLVSKLYNPLKQQEEHTHLFTDLPFSCQVSEIKSVDLISIQNQPKLKVNKYQKRIFNLLFRCTYLLKENKIAFATALWTILVPFSIDKTNKN